MSWDNAACSLVEVDRRFGCAYCLHHQGSKPLMMDVVSISKTSINFYETTQSNVPEVYNLRIPDKLQGIFFELALRE
jgi:hypothetical protein